MRRKNFVKKKKELQEARIDIQDGEKVRLKGLKACLI